MGKDYEGERADDYGYGYMTKWKGADPSGDGLKRKPLPKRTSKKIRKAEQNAVNTDEA